MGTSRLGNAIRKLRETKGLTQAQLAEAAKVTRPYITMLESGAQKEPSPGVLKRLPKALSMPVTELVE